MRYGSREWFALTPDEIRRRRMRRRHENVAGLAVFEPADEEEVSLLWDRMRKEEKREALDAGGDKAAHRKAVFSAERTFAVYHGDVLLALATVYVLPKGGHGLSMERTVAALIKGHRFTWLRAYGPLSRWICGQYPDGLWTMTPVDLPRALDVYRHAGAEVVGRTTFKGREYFVLRLEN